MTTDKFICQKCGHTDHADINAGKNIRDKGFPLLHILYNEMIDLKNKILNHKSAVGTTVTDAIGVDNYV